jgi:hypothetical protein
MASLPEWVGSRRSSTRSSRTMGDPTTSPRACRLPCSTPPAPEARATSSARCVRIERPNWHPVRRHIRDFGQRGGITFSGDTMRLHARVFARDLFQFDAADHHELGEQDVAFVLTLSDGSDSSDLYNSMAQRLGTFVESAVVEQAIEVEG